MVMPSISAPLAHFPRMVQEQKQRLPPTTRSNKTYGETPPTRMTCRHRLQVWNPVSCTGTTTMPRFIAPQILCLRTMLERRQQLPSTTRSNMTYGETPPTRRTCPSRQRLRDPGSITSTTSPPRSTPPSTMLECRTSSKPPSRRRTTPPRTTSARLLWTPVLQTLAVRMA